MQQDPDHEQVMDDDQTYRAPDLLIEAGKRRFYVADAPIEVV